MTVRIQLRRGTAAFWTDENPILHLGEPGYEIDTKRMKLGDGETHWRELPYFAGGGGTGGGGGTPDEDIPDLVIYYENGKV
jgi:hypothetical protein